jgi:integrase
MTTKPKSAEHIEEQELNKLLKYLYQNQKWTYYLLVSLGVSTSLRYSDLSRITWEMVFGRQTLLIKEKKTGKVREIPLWEELVVILHKVYLKLNSPKTQQEIIPLNIRTINK